MTNHWLVVHDAPSYIQHPDKVGLNKNAAKSDRIFRTIKKDDRIIYYARQANKQAIGIFNVASSGYLSPKRLWGGKPYEHYVYDIEPVYISPIGHFGQIDTKKFGIKTLHGRTAIKLTHNQYKNIVTEMLGMQDPTDEDEVIALFSKIHQYLGFVSIKSIGRSFPDCMASKKRKEVRIEFEEPSSMFNSHGHNPKDCDLIVCWTDDLGPLAPVSVLEMREFVYGH
jgi:hypothetical protein